MNSQKFKNLSEFIKRAQKNHFFRYGLPFIMFVTGGSFVLKQFASVRYEVSRHNKQLGVTADLLKEVGFELKAPKTLEEEYEEVVKTTDTDNWKNIRGPRPWEEPSKEYIEMIEKRAQEVKQKN